MADFEIRLDTTGLDAALKQLDSRQVYVALNLWFKRGAEYVQGELKARAPGQLSKKTYIRYDTMRPPRWARISVKSPLAWLIEGGTGSVGDPAFKHVARHWPSTPGIMTATGLPAPQAFLVARAIGLRGGNPPRPFIKPTYDATKARLEQMALEAVAAALQGATQ
jgi:hypothetical protein